MKLFLHFCQLHEETRISSAENSLKRWWKLSRKKCKFYGIDLVCIFKCIDILMCEGICINLFTHLLIIYSAVGIETLPRNSKFITS